jgi:predicted ATPase
VRLDRLAVRGFKNLRDIEIDFDAEKLETVVIGQNGTGKSNVIEAISTIFRDLDDPKHNTPFPYQLEYACKGHKVAIDHRYSDPDAMKVTVDGKRSSTAALRGKGGQYLPNHVFGYYSGASERLQAIFDPPQRTYYEAAIEAGAETRLDPRRSELRRLFFVRERYGALALLTYFAFGNIETQRFLEKHLGVKGFDSALLTLRQPGWSKRHKPSPEILAQSDPRFWNARGIVRRLLDGLWDQCLAPIRHEASEREDYRGHGTQEKQVFIYLKDVQSLLALAQPFEEEQRFFSYLETLDLSDLVRSIRIWVQREGASTTIPFHEISDGEKQLLSVLGMMRFAAHDDSLFLLDEPDTHLNPAWKWNYLALIQEVAGLNSNCHLIMTSHDPLTVGGLEQSQVRILYHDSNGDVRADKPGVDPKGLGVSGVLRQIFGLATTLDPETQRIVERRNALLAQTLRNKADGVAVPPELSNELFALNDRLDKLGLAYQSNDPQYDAYLRAIHRTAQESSTAFTPEEITAQNRYLERIIEGLL